MGKQDVSNRNRVQPGTKDSAGRKGGQFAPETSGRNAPNTKPAAKQPVQLEPQQKNSSSLLEGKYEKYAQNHTPTEITIKTPCVATRHVNMHDDSDFYGVFWVDGEFKQECVGSTRHAGGFIPSVNADLELQQKYDTWWKREKRQFDADMRNMKQRVVAKGSVVKVDRPRSKHHGKEGVVESVVDNRYAYGKKNAKIREDDGSVSYVPVEYCSVETTNENGTTSWESQMSETEVAAYSRKWYEQHPASKTVS